MKAHSPPKSLITMQSEIGAALSSRIEDFSKASHLVIDTTWLSSMDRLGIYRYAYSTRIIEAIIEIFEATTAIGKNLDWNMEEIYRGYMDAYPSQYPSLSQVGHKLPQYLSQLESESLPNWIPELARLEWIAWTVTHSSCSADNKPVSPPQDWSRTQILFDPSLQLVESPYELSSYWPWEDTKDQHTPPKKKRSYFLLWYQKDKGTSLLPIERAAFETLIKIKQRQTLSSIFEQMNQLFPSLEPEKLAGWFQHWTELGILLGFKETR